MTDLDRTSLDRILPSTTGSPDWDDVMSRSRAQLGRRRRRVVVALAAAALVAVGTASAFGSVRDIFRHVSHQLAARNRRAAAPAGKARADGGGHSVLVQSAERVGKVQDPSDREVSLERRSRSTSPAKGPQGAEAIIYWTSFPDGDHADPCALELAPSVGPSAADLAAAVSTAPGTKLVKGPSNVTLGGHPAKHVVLTVREYVGCDPGFFYTWREVFGGAFWRTTLWATRSGFGSSLCAARASSNARASSSRPRPERTRARCWRERSSRSSDRSASSRSSCGRRPVVDLAAAPD